MHVQTHRHFPKTTLQVSPKQISPKKSQNICWPDLHTFCVLQYIVRKLKLRTLNDMSHQLVRGKERFSSIDIFKIKQKRQLFESTQLGTVSTCWIGYSQTNSQHRANNATIITQSALWLHRFPCLSCCVCVSNRLVMSL